MSVRDILQGAAGAAGGPLQSLVATSSGGSAPFLYAYPFDVNTGLGARYSDPAVTPCYGVKFSPDKKAILVGISSGENVSAWAWTDGVGFGAKFSPPSPLPSGFGWAVGFNPSGSVVAWVSVTPLIEAQQFSSSTGFGTRYSNPSILPNGGANALHFHPSGNSVAVGHTLSPFITVYEWSDSTGFGAKYADPATVPAGQVNGVEFSPDGNALVTVNRGGTYITAWQWSNSTGFGTQFSTPSLTRVGTGMAFHPSGSCVAFSYEVSNPDVNVYPFSSSTGFNFTSLPRPTSVTSASAQRIAFNSTGDAIAVTSSGAPYLFVYKFSTTNGILSPNFTIPAPALTGASYGVAFT